ncbi:RxLR-like protein [Plasmopara halstedii]|uniref:RxLR-like protein n=1 Tax=Plasmopara halstedii TaxID=4781 RepID=A0A0P1ANI4_PLAHL|nr:RxLR-like protein [Plasmopara halstedii]CEG42545.1 RxLR-like protein [Plasmopara halstedii]|eukprot:XP_024578914.1 RxLR-like protein [Plasmopara halstedii]
MVFRFMLLCGALSASSVAQTDDLPDFPQYSPQCVPFECRPTRAPAPVKDFEFTSNGCGTSGFQVSTSKDLEECCNWHDACYSVCGMPKKICEKRLKSCMHATCHEKRTAKEREDCFTTAKIFYISANMMACPAYEDAQKEACECVPEDTVATATRQRLEYFLEENGASEKELSDEAIDALLTKYKGQEPKMFYRLLKKYPKALKRDPEKTNFMDNVVKNVDNSLKKEKLTKRKNVKKEEPVDEHEEL